MNIENFNDRELELQKCKSCFTELNAKNNLISMEKYILNMKKANFGNLNLFIQSLEGVLLKNAKISFYIDKSIYCKKNLKQSPIMQFNSDLNGNLFIHNIQYENYTIIIEHQNFKIFCLNLKINRLVYNYDVYLISPLKKKQVKLLITHEIDLDAYLMMNYALDEKNECFVGILQEKCIESKFKFNILFIIKNNMSIMFFI